MTRMLTMIWIGIALLAMLAACGPSSQNGEIGTPETPITDPTETLEREFDLAALTIELIEKGGAVGVGDEVTQPFFSVTGQSIFVKEETVQVFTHDSPAAARAQADLVGPDGFTVGTTSISWVAPPHFYLRDSLLVLYVGGNGPVIDLLEAIMGPQFAGADTSAVNPNSYPDDEVRNYLLLMVDLSSYLSALVSGRSSEEFAIEWIITVASQLEGYTEFFTELEGDQRDYVFETYGDDFRQSADRVANIATTNEEISGNEVIAQALARIPAFAIASVTTSSSTGATIEPEQVPAGYIGTLLLPGEVAALADGVELTTEYVDRRSMVEIADPTSVEHMDSFDSLSFNAPASLKGLTLTTLKFDSASGAATHLEQMTAESPAIQELSSKIGDVSFYAEVNQSGFGSFVLFRKGEWVVTLHTFQPDGAAPLVDLESLESLARMVAGRI